MLPPALPGPPGLWQIEQLTSMYARAIVSIGAAEKKAAPKKAAAKKTDEAGAEAPAAEA